jgi:hypothetical protein
MAEQGYGCIWGDCAQPVAVIITTLTNGASVSLCGEHYGPGMIPLLAAELGVDPGDFYANVEGYLKRAQKKADKALADARSGDADQGSQGPAVVQCGYCGEPLDDGESHVHAGQLDQGDAQVTA